MLQFSVIIKLSILTKANYTGIRLVEVEADLQQLQAQSETTLLTADG